MTKVTEITCSICDKGILNSLDSSVTEVMNFKDLETRRQSQMNTGVMDCLYILFKPR